LNTMDAFETLRIESNKQLYYDTMGILSLVY